MITLVIIGILAGIAYPTYVQYIAKASRSEALAALMRIVNLQEQYYLDNKTYTSDLKKLGLNDSSNITPHQDYSLTLNATVSSYKITATAQKAQKNRDRYCLTISITDTGLKLPLECWQ